MKLKPKEEKICKFIDDIMWLFEIQNYTKTIKFPSKDEEHGDNKCTAADIVFDSIYRTVVIRIFPVFWEWSKENQAKAIIHELCHCRTGDLADCADNLLNWTLVTSEEVRHAKENTTEYMAQIFFELAIGNKKYFSEAIKEYLK